MFQSEYQFKQYMCEKYEINNIKPSRLKVKLHDILWEKDIVDNVSSSAEIKLQVLDVLEVFFQCSDIHNRWNMEFQRVADDVDNKYSLPTGKKANEYYSNKKGGDYTKAINHFYTALIERMSAEEKFLFEVTPNAMPHSVSKFECVFLWEMEAVIQRLIHEIQRYNHLSEGINGKVEAWHQIRSVIRNYLNEGVGFSEDTIYATTVKMAVLNKSYNQIMSKIYAAKHHKECCEKEFDLLITALRKYRETKNVKEALMSTFESESLDDDLYDLSEFILGMYFKIRFKGAGVDVEGEVSRQENVLVMCFLIMCDLNNKSKINFEIMGLKNSSYSIIKNLKSMMENRDKVEMLSDDVLQYYADRYSAFSLVETDFNEGVINISDLRMEVKDYFSERIFRHECLLELYDLLSLSSIKEVSGVLEGMKMLRSILPNIDTLNRA